MRPLARLAVWTGLTLAMAASGVFTRADLAFFDGFSWTRLAASRGKESGLPVVVAIDGPALLEYGRWPWPRKLLADLLRRLLEGRPCAVGIDLLLAEPAPGDDALADAIRGHPVVLAEKLDLRRRSKGDIVIGHPEPPVPQLAAAAIGTGFIDFFPDYDGVARRMLWRAGSGTRERLSLAAALAEAAGQPRLEHSEEVLLTIASIPARGETISAADLLAGRVSPSLWHERPVLVGLTAAGIAGDSYPLALRALGKVPGVYLHAYAFATLTAWGGVRAMPLSFAILLVAAVCAIMAVLTSRAGPWQLAGRTAGISLAVLAVSLILFHHGWWWGPSLPLGALIVGGAVQIIERSAASHRREQELRAIFAKYGSAQALEQILAGPTPQLGGEAREITVLFADLRGFSSLAEGRQPAAVAQDLNRHLAVMSRGILAEGGMVDKFIGDGVMGVFGAPLLAADHRRHALAAAATIRRELNQPGYLAPGIGIACGWALVGNVGSGDRLDYTAIGDPVNLAARLEEMAGPNEILAEAGCFCGSPGPGWEVIADVPVRGREAAVTVCRSVMGITDVTVEKR